MDSLKLKTGELYGFVMYNSCLDGKIEENPKIFFLKNMELELRRGIEEDHDVNWGFGFPLLFVLELNLEKFRLF